jgi:mycothiol synthase
LPVLPPPDPARYGLPLHAVAHGEIAVRKAHPEDAPRIAELLNAHAVASFGEPDVSTSEVAHWLGLPRIRFWVAERDGRLCAYVDVGERAERTRYWLDLRGTDPEATEALLGTAEGWAHQRAAPGARLFGGIAEPDRSTRDVYETAGFRLVRYSFDMRIELDAEVPEPAWPSGLSVRTFEPGSDDERAFELVNDAFADHWEWAPIPLEEWRRGSLEDPDFDPALVFLVEAEGELVGVALNLVRNPGEPLGWVETLAVRNERRRQGLGVALLQQSFRVFRERGLARAGLHVDAENTTGAVRVYERAGMHVHGRWVTYEKAVSEPLPSA